MGHYATVRTQLGTLAIGFGERGISRILLPRQDWSELQPAYLAAAGLDTETRAPREIAPVAAALRAHIAGDVQDFSDVVLDTEGSSAFSLQARRAARAIPPGQTRTYGELAAAAGSPRAVRAVGAAMATNPWPIIVPCHRVFAATGFGEYSAGSGVATKLRLLWREGYRGRTSNVAFDEHRAIAHLRAADPRLAKLIDRAGPFTLQAEAPRPRGGTAPFASLARAIVAQQLSGKAAATIYHRVAALTGDDSIGDATAVLALPQARLRSAGLSQNKALAIADLARHAVDGSMPTRGAMQDMSDDDIVERLASIRGVGRWSAQMLLMFYLGRPNVLPVADLGVQKGFAIAYGTRGLPSAKTMEKVARNWSPFASVASWYLWRAVEIARYGAAGARSA